MFIKNFGKNFRKWEVFISKEFIMKFTITEEEKRTIKRMYLLEDENTDGIIIKPKSGDNGDNVNVLVKLVANDYDSINNLKSIESFLLQNKSKSENLNCGDSMPTNESYNLSEAVIIKPKPEDCEPGVCDKYTVIERMQRFYTELSRLSEESIYLTPFIEKTDWCK